MEGHADKRDDAGFQKLKHIFHREKGGSAQIIVDIVISADDGIYSTSV